MSAGAARVFIVFGEYCSDGKCLHLTEECFWVSAALMTANKEHMVLSES